jgi:lysosomal Pro-X carboxypeptidase
MANRSLTHQALTASVVYKSASDLLSATGTEGCMNYLTSEQALADYAYLVYYLKASLHAENNPVIGFGGSYGGMLAAWGRFKYPNAFDGVISASAPIWSFPGMDPPYNYNAFWEIATADASKAAGATDYCKSNLKEAWQRILKAGETEQGDASLAANRPMISPLQP